MYLCVYTCSLIVSPFFSTELLPCLFISEEERAKLAGLVLLDPTWLFHIMKNVVELDYRSSIKGQLIRELRETGIASRELLQQCWSEYLCEPIEDSFNQMRLMMQAECLIHPIKLVPESSTDQPSTDASSELQSSPPKPADNKSLYLVPSKMPDKVKKELASKSPRWVTFYFDFQKFLPEVIFHRVICLLLAVSQANPSFDNPYLSKSMCQFTRIDSCHWKVELQRKCQRLKISVL